MKKTNIGIIGCGGICTFYLKRLICSNYVNVVSCADIINEKATSIANQFHIPKTESVDELLNNPDVEVVLNLTTPDAHYEINKAVINAGKHLYTEKPVSLTLEQAKEIFNLAEKRGVRVGCAPDTILGQTIQTTKSIIDSGSIGRITSGTMNLCNAMFKFELWYPEPSHLFEQGGGPLWDTGVYHFSELVYLLGSVKRVTAFAHKSSNTRTVKSRLNFGKTIDVKIYTHYSGALEFVNGAIVSFTASSDCWNSHLPEFELYGENGTIIVPDPINYEGNVRVLHGEDVLECSKELDFLERAFRMINSDDCYYIEVPVLPHDANVWYGIGLEKMALALQTNGVILTSEKLAYHVLDIMSSIDRAALEGRVIELSSSAE